MSVGKLTHNALPFANVVASGVATNNITPGRTLDLFQLELGGTAFTKAMISLIKIKANGKTLIEVGGSDMDLINQYKGLTADAAFLDILFYDDSMRTHVDRSVSAFDTSNGIANITSEITIAGATAPTLKGILREAAAQKDTGGNAAPYAGLVGKLLKYPFNMPNGGTLPISVPFGAQSGAVIKRMYIIQGTGNMTGATVKQDGMVVHESTAAENTYMQKRVGRVPQAKMYVIDFVIEGSIANALDTRDAKSLEWLLTFSAADTGTVYVEYLDAIGNL